VLREKQVILTDAGQIIAIYPYRDADATKVTMDTRNILILTCGIPRVGREKVTTTYEVCAGFLERYTGGIPSGPEIFPDSEIQADT
jgi:DNA/RNA-binding domain of Phe-tRNA-synthetase-like protein